MTAEIPVKRRLLVETNALIKTNDPGETLRAFAAILGCLGELMSGWTGEVVRVRVTAEGKPDQLDMVKYPDASAPH